MHRLQAQADLVDPALATSAVHLHLVSMGHLQASSVDQRLLRRRQRATSLVNNPTWTCPEPQMNFARL